MHTNKIIEPISYVLMAIMLIGCFVLHLMSTLVSGLLIYLVVTHFYKMIEPKVRKGIANKITLIMLITLCTLILTAIFFGFYSAIKVGNENIKNMGQDAFNILQELKRYLPLAIVNYIPDDVLILKEKVAELIKDSGGHIFEMTGTSLKVIVHVLLGLLLGAIIAFSFLKPEEDESSKEPRPLKDVLKKRIIIFTEVFRKVISAQVKISAINTVLTAIYLLIVLPIFSVHLPYAKTLVFITFAVGLIPVLGNLISNTLIFLISLTVSFKIAIVSILFLIIIHKLEYYINAKIVGEKIKTSIWELLLAMVVMETLFGLIGVALAPVIYGYIKEELKLKKLI